MKAVMVLAWDFPEWDDEQATPASMTAWRDAAQRTVDYAKTQYPTAQAGYLGIGPSAAAVLDVFVDGI